MRYIIKQGSKTYEYVKELLEKEDKEREAYFSRVEEAVGCEFVDYRGPNPNSSFVRAFFFLGIKIRKEDYENKIDKKIWVKEVEDGNYVGIKPDMRTKKGKEISKVFQSCKSFTDNITLTAQLGIKTELHGRSSMPMLLREGDFLVIKFDDSIRVDKDNPDLVEITGNEYVPIINNGAMRQIKFKAKRLDNGEWVEGDLSHEVYRTDGDYRNYTTIRTPIKNNHGETMAHTIYQVDPSTVCQFTGLKDKDGKEIWEHDLLKDSRTTCEVICAKGCFSIKTQIGFVPFATTIIDKEQLSFFTNIGSKFDRKEEK